LQFGNLVPKVLAEHLELTLPLDLHHPEVQEHLLQLALVRQPKTFFLIS
jgi:hypothetical protein